MRKPPRKDTGFIELGGVRVNNLKNIDLSIPRGKLTVVTGVSGSGKSSLAFETLYAEGQRRYVESLSSYARQFLDRMPKPDADWIRFIPPAVAIKQSAISRNPRSLVATACEVYDFFKLLWARFGKTISPLSGREVKKHTIVDVAAFVLTHRVGERFLVMAPIVLAEGRTMGEQLELLQRAGYSRVWADGKVSSIAEALEAQSLYSSFYIVVDRLKVSHEDELKTRLADAVEVAFFEGRGVATILMVDSGIKTEFCNRFEMDGRTFTEPVPELFDFNSPSGACPTCEGFGQTIGISEGLVIPDPSLSVIEGAVACWKGTKAMSWKNQFVSRALRRYNFRVMTPYERLTAEEKKLLWEGCHEDEAQPILGINDYFNLLRRDYYKVQNRVRIAHFSGRTLCHECLGARLSEDARCVQVGGKTLPEVMRMTCRDALGFFTQLALGESEKKAGERLLQEITHRLQLIREVGLGYLTLDRPSNSLSGGENQRLNLASRIGSNLYGALYVLDEPSIGLHDWDTDHLIEVIKKLRDAGNTLVVVEHDERIISAADYLIDIGPGAGREGGKVILSAPMEQINESSPGVTVEYLFGKRAIPLPKFRRLFRSSFTVAHANKNNLKDLSVKIPLEVLVVVTGVSGSGKSTLVRDIVYERLRRQLSDHSFVVTDQLSGDYCRVQNVQYVDQNSVGKSARSNPATYIGIWDDVRELFSSQTLARQMGYLPYYFSFNKPGGRCETCKGEGIVTVEMQFMADLELRCETCQGKRFKREILDVTYHDVNVDDLLSFTVNEAVEFFQQYPSPPLTDRIVKRLRVLQQVGLGYLHLGQSSSTLSGGENQRLKLAFYLAQSHAQPTLFIFDEPTTGLHIHDIHTLLKAFEALLNEGHSILVIEHNIQVIKCADYVIDMGPGAADEGGQVVVAGTPEEVAASPNSYTAKYLRKALGL